MMARFLVSLVALLAIFLASLANLDLENIFLGVVVSALLLAVFWRFNNPNGLFRPIPNLFGRALAFIPFSIVSLWDILTGSWKVLLVALHLSPVDLSGLVEIPIDERGRLGVAVTALKTTMTPGSALVEVDWDEGKMIFSYLNASDPEKIRQKQRRFYEQYQRKVFP